MNYKLALLVIAALLLAKQTQAACTNIIRAGVFSDNIPNPLPIHSGLLDGGIIYTGPMTRKVTPSATCTNSNLLYFSMSSTFAATPNVYKTGTAGIGVSIMYLTPYLTFPATSATVNLNPVSNATVPVLTLVKTGPITATTLQPVTGSTWGVINATNNAAIPLYSVTNPAQIALVPSACDVTSPANIVVNLGNIHSSHFLGVGTTVPSQDFSIGLNCNGVTNVSLSLNGSAIDANNGVLALSTDANAATGVGVQISNDAGPFPLNTMKLLGVYPGGINTIDLTATYIQTAEVITGGSANSSASFTLNYD